MAKISDMSLPELYERKMTGTVEKAILEKENFLVKADNWCEKVCKLKCKNPPATGMFPNNEVDVLIIQDYNAFDEPIFRKRGSDIEKKHREILSYIASNTLIKEDGSKYSLAMTNLLKCSLSAADLKKGKAPTDTILAKCRPYLLKEIEVRKPKVIISLNKAVTNILGLKKSNYRDCGDILQYNGIPVILTLHPKSLIMLRQNASGAAWGPDFYSVLLNDFRKISQILRGTLDIPNLEVAIEDAKKRIFIARTMEQVIAFCKEITELGMAGIICSFDTETTGLDPFSPNAKIICMQFGVRDPKTNLLVSYVFPMWHRDNTWYNADEAWENIKPILLQKKIKKVGHNMKFDMLYIEATLGIRIQGVIYDTMLLLHAINSGLQGMYGLKRAVGNVIPDSGLQGYEDKLPKLTRIKKEEDGDGTEGDEEETEGEEGNGSTSEN